jgi:protease secretion system outer membrane protein
MRLKWRRRALAVAIGGMAWCGHASALGLLQAYDAALQNDPDYRSAYFVREGGKENAILGRSALLPTLQGTFNTSKNVADITSNSAFGQTVDHPKYTSRVASVDLRQPLFSLDAWARFKEGKAQARQAEAQFSSQQQEVILRVTGAYVEALFADEQVALSRATRDTYAEQRKVNDRMFERGEGTRTDMLETQAKLDMAEAQVLEAQDNQFNTRAALQAIIGMEVTSLDALLPEFHSVALPAGGLEYWQKTARDANPDLAAQMEAIEVAKQEVNRNRAGHTPRVDFVASYSKNKSDTINTYDQDSTVRSLGVQINIPLYAGGAVSASTRQAGAGLGKARADYDSRAEKLSVEVRKQYNAVVSSVSKIQALEKAVSSSELLMAATRQSIKGGVRINLDLLNAQQQLYTNKRDLAQARYAYLVAVLRLRSAAGVLGVDDVREVAANFR